MKSKLAVPSPLSTKVAFNGSGTTDIKAGIPSGSLVLIIKLKVDPSKIVWSPIAARTGGWLPASITVIVILSVVVRILSSPSGASATIIQTSYRLA